MSLGRTPLPSQTRTFADRRRDTWPSASCFGASRVFWIVMHFTIFRIYCVTAAFALGIGTLCVPVWSEHVVVFWHGVQRLGG